MPFCTSCGAEIAADKKFCGQCGAPQEAGTAPAVPETPAVHEAPLPPGEPPVFRPPPSKPILPKNPVIIGIIIALIVIMAVVYIVGLPMLKVGGQKTIEGMVPSPSVTPALYQTTQPTPQSTLPIITTIIPETTTLPVQELDARLEEEYEPIYSLNQNFSFGQKVQFAHELTRPPLYVQFNLTPVLITRHRLVSAETRNEHYENTTEASPYAWFEVKVLDAGTGEVVDQQGYGKDYPDLTKSSFMVRKKGNYRIEMSGNDVFAEVRMLIGTP
ncbi:MAG: zinc ribbon domain-containing protein [Methanoregula sp.]